MLDAVLFQGARPARPPGGLDHGHEQRGNRGFSSVGFAASGPELPETTEGAQSLSDAVQVADFVAVAFSRGSVGPDSLGDPIVR